MFLGLTRKIIIGRIFPFHTIDLFSDLLSGRYRCFGYFKTDKNRTIHPIFTSFSVSLSEVNLNPRIVILPLLTRALMFDFFTTNELNPRIRLPHLERIEIRDVKNTDHSSTFFSEKFFHSCSLDLTKLKHFVVRKMGGAECHENSHEIFSRKNQQALLKAINLQTIEISHFSNIFDIPFTRHKCFPKLQLLRLIETNCEHFKSWKIPFNNLQIFEISNCGIETEEFFKLHNSFSSLQKFTLLDTFLTESHSGVPNSILTSIPIQKLTHLTLRLRNSDLLIFNKNHAFDLIFFFLPIIQKISSNNIIKLDFVFSDLDISVFQPDSPPLALYLPNLKEFRYTSFGKIEKKTFAHFRFPKLQKLRVRVMSISHPEWNKNFRTVKDLRIKGLRNESFECSCFRNESFPGLEKLEIVEVSKFHFLDGDKNRGWSLPNLKNLKIISCSKFQERVLKRSEFPRLEKIRLGHLESVTGSSLGKFKNLKKVGIKSVGSFRNSFFRNSELGLDVLCLAGMSRICENRWNLGLKEKLRILDIRSCSGITDDLFRQKNKFRKLERLILAGLSLTGEGWTGLPSLKRMEMFECRSFSDALFQSAETSVPKLEFVAVNGCPRISFVSWTLDPNAFVLATLIPTDSLHQRLHNINELSRRSFSFTMIVADPNEMDVRQSVRGGKRVTTVTDHRTPNDLEYDENGELRWKTENPIKLLQPFNRTFYELDFDTSKVKDFSVDLRNNAKMKRKNHSKFARFSILRKFLYFPTVKNIPHSIVNYTYYERDWKFRGGGMAFEKKLKWFLIAEVVRSERGDFPFVLRDLARNEVFVKMKERSEKLRRIISRLKIGDCVAIRYAMKDREDGNIVYTESISRNIFVFKCGMKKLLRISDVIAEYRNSCFCCGIGERKLRLCSSCKVAKYCSKGCQKKDWGKHKKLCSIVLKKFKKSFLDIDYDNHVNK